jgi:hypothetical protein
MLAGTLNDDDVKLEPMDYGCRYFPLPLFKFDMITAILNYCVDNKMIPRWATGPAYYRYWWMMGLIPRTLVFALITLNEMKYDSDQRLVNKNDIDILDELYIKTSNKLKGYYTSKYDANDADHCQLLKFSCTNVDMKSFGTSVSDWIKTKKRTGKVFTNTEQNTIFLPQVVFLELNENSNENPFQGLPVFYRFTWEDYEIMDLRKITNSINLFFEMQVKTVSLRTLLRAGGTQKTLDLNITINQRVFREEVENFVSVDNVKKQVLYHHLYDAVVTDNQINGGDLLNYVFKTKRGCYLVDGRIWLDKKHLLFIQYRYRLPPDSPNDVLDWVNTVKEVLEKEHSSYTLIYLYVTAAARFQRNKRLQLEVLWIMYCTWIK